MKTNKFRGWHKPTKKMFEVYGLSPIAVEEKRDGISYVYDRKEVVLMQYIELEDKNGDEICEGDICIWRLFDRYEMKKVKVRIVYMSDEARFVGQRLEPGTNFISLINADVGLEIEGNIFKNPELLEVEYQC